MRQGRGGSRFCKFEVVICSTHWPESQRLLRHCALEEYHSQLALCSTGGPKLAEGINLNWALWGWFWREEKELQMGLGVGDSISVADIDKC